MKLSVIISNRNDILMLAITIRSVIEALRPVGLDRSEIVICDNSFRESYMEITKNIPNAYLNSGLVKISYQEFPCLFTARETAAREASGEYLLCLDSHMLIGHNMILDLFNFMEHSAPANIGFAHAPIIWCHHDDSMAKHDRDTTGPQPGKWGRAYDTPTPISWKGMPWICRREFFLGPLGGYGALSQHQLGWGGGDMHIGLKPWILGFENWAVPTTPGTHIGRLPGSKNEKFKYRNYTTSGRYPKCLGFLVSSWVLGGDENVRRDTPKLEGVFKLDVRGLLPTAKKLGRDEREMILANQEYPLAQLLERPRWASTTNPIDVPGRIF